MRILVAMLITFQASFASAQDAETGNGLFAYFYASCHGRAAQGDGPMANILLVQPTDLTTLSKSNNGVFPYERVAKRIDGRDALVSHGSDMPVFGWLFQDSQVSFKLPSGQPMLTDRPVAALIAYLKTIQM